MSILQNITHPTQIRDLNESEMRELAEEIRAEIIAVTAKNGGHIGPNLGVVELTLALHRVFQTPEDRIVFDVAHQGYVHKLLTGRNGPAFRSIRQSDGLCGFLARSESPHDCYGAGHAGTALSAALGMAVARDRSGGGEHVVAVIGDATLTCGIAFEALNNISITTKRLIVILNDNKWSIARNVGAIASYLNEIITNPIYNKVDRDLQHFLERVPGGGTLIELGRRWKKETKDFLVSSSLFESFGLRYIGPVDGHNQEELEHYLEFAKSTNSPILLHVLTQKGKGFSTALEHPERFHGTSPFDPETGTSRKKAGAPPNYQDVFGDAMVRYARRDPRVCGITAAMPSGTGLNRIAEALPDQFFDVGIAEEHAVLFAAGMATRDRKPVVGIYSTFLQRAYDQIVHDVCLQELPVVFCLDRAGLSPNDGPTHHGLFDIAYLRGIPATVVAQPKDEDELCDLLWTALEYGKPMFIRYPRGAARGVPIKPEPSAIPIGTAEVLEPGESIQIWALGPWIDDALKLAVRLREETSASIGVVNARFAKPVDRTLLLQQASAATLFVTMEDHTAAGGFGSALLQELQSNGVNAPVEVIGWPDHFVSHGSSVSDLREANGLGPEAIASRVLARWQSLHAPPIGVTGSGSDLVYRK